MEFLMSWVITDCLKKGQLTSLYWRYMILRPARTCGCFVEFQRAPYTNAWSAAFPMSCCPYGPINKSCTLLWRCLASASPRICGHHTTNNTRLAQPVSKLARHLTFVTCFQQVIGSNLGRQTDYSDWGPCSSSVPASKIHNSTSNYPFTSLAIRYTLISILFWRYDFRAIVI